MKRNLAVFLLILVVLMACSERQEKPAESPAPVVDAAFRAEAGKVLESVTTVLTGYRAFSGHGVQALADLDTGDYMFGSDYLADLVPEGGHLYLTLGQTPQEVRMWLEKDGEPRALGRSLTSSGLTSYDTREMQDLKSRWQQVSSIGRLTQVSL